jgi:GGDEF domain-containing protein
MNVSARFDNAGLFVSILGGVATHGAETFVQRVRRDLGTIDTGTPQQLVISTSVCGYRPEIQTLEEFLSNAHGALAEAKAKGGNQVVVVD